MKRAFKEAYERELVLLHERAAQFQEDFPREAIGLGGLLKENLDPSIQGLLEGTAFLAARVQLNIDQQFRTFSSELLQQICPDATAPLPSALILQTPPPGKPSDLAEGRTIEAGEYVETSNYGGKALKLNGRPVTCRFRFAEPVTFWPLVITDAAYHGAATPLTAMGLETDRDTAGGLVISFKRTDDEPLGTLPITDLPIHFIGPLRDAMALYEQAFSQLKRMTLMWRDSSGDPVFRRVPVESLEQVGFDPDLPLYGRDERLFPGFSTLLEYFSFPRKFLGFKLTKLDEAFRDLPKTEVQLIMEFKQADQNLATQFSPAQLGLYCAPAVNLFEDDLKPEKVDETKHRYAVTPNRTPQTHYEVQRVISVRAQRAKSRSMVQVLPLYAVPNTDQSPRDTMYYALETQRRGLSRDERNIGGTQFRYEGTESWLTLYEPPDDDGDGASRLFIRTLCSNRHLPEVLPLSEAEYVLSNDQTLSFTCVAGPSEPREAVAELESEAPHRMQSGDNYWRLISILSLSYRGLLGLDGKGNIGHLREVMRLFSDVSDQLSEAQINGLLKMEASPTLKTVKRPEGYLPTRGTRIAITFDENVFSAGAAITLSAVLDRFLADYAAVNTFTQCVARNRKGEDIKVWPPRGGSGPVL